MDDKHQEELDIESDSSFLDDDDDDGDDDDNDDSKVCDWIHELFGLYIYYYNNNTCKWKLTTHTYDQHLI